MLSFLGLPMIVAAWALPALFLAILAGLFSFAALRPVFRVWSRVFDVAVGVVARVALQAASGLASAAYEHAEKHPVRYR